MLVDVGRRACKLRILIHAGEEVTGGSVIVSMMYKSAIPVVQKMYNICDMAPQLDEECPLEPGTHEVAFTGNIPSYAPSVSRILTKV